MTQLDKIPEKTSVSQKIVRAIIGILFVIIVTIGMIEASLYFLDPLGIVAYFHSFKMLEEARIPSETGYTFAMGEYEMLDYSYTINADESRLVPATNNNAECTIATIGDSLTFGMGVEDDETWVNILAETYPDVHFLNYGRPMFSSGNVLRSYNTYEADAYMWLIISNDDFPDSEYYPSKGGYSLASRLYWIYVLYPLIFNELPYDVLYEEGVPIATNTTSPSANVADEIANNTFIFGFDEFPTNNVEQAIIIPAFTEVNSAIDPHPSAVGNQQIADAILPYMDDFIREQCG